MYSIYLLLAINILCFATDSYSFDIINKNGNSLYRIEDAKDIYFSSRDTMIISYKDGFEIIDTNLRTKLKSNLHIRQFAKIRDNRLAFWDGNNKKYGYLDSHGNVSISAKFDYAEDFTNGFAIVGFGDTNEPPPHLFDKKIIDVYGNYFITNNVSPFSLSTTSSGKGIGGTGNGAVIIEYNNGQWIPLLDIGIFESLNETGDYLIYRIDGHYGFMTWEGLRLTGNIYNGIYRNYSSLYAVIMGNADYFIVNAYGEKIPTIDNTLSIVNNETYAVFEKDRKVGVYDLTKNQIIINPQFDSMKYSEDVFVVELEGKFGYLSIDGHYIASVKYDGCYPFYNGLGIVQMKKQKL